MISTSAISTGLYLTKRFLDRKCPRVPLTALPRSSACRNLVENAVEGADDRSISDPRRNLAWGLEDLQRVPLLASWPGTSANDNNPGVKAHHITSFVALQAEIPASFLEGYVSTRKRSNSHHAKKTGNDRNGTSRLAENFLAAFLDAMATNPERWFLDGKDLPPLSFKPGTQIAGGRNANSGLFGAFMLGTWSSTAGAEKSLDTDSSVLPPNVTRLPVTNFPSNEHAISSTNPTDGKEDAAGAVFYYRFTERFILAIDKINSWVGLPWTTLEGGYQEFIVERIPGNDQMVRVSYVPVECAALAWYSSKSIFSTDREGLAVGSDAGNSKEGYLMGLPWVFYEAHVFYAKFLLWNAIRHLKKNSKSKVV